MDYKMDLRIESTLTRCTVLLTLQTATEDSRTTWDEKGDYRIGSLSISTLTYRQGRPGLG